MGLDFSYLLYFKRERLWDALQGVAAVSRPSQLPTLIAFPDHMLSLSLGSWDEKERIYQYNDSEFGFATSMYFPEDAEIRDYTKRVFPDYYNEMAKESPKGIPVGYIYLTVYNDLQSLDQDDIDPGLVMMEFGTTGTNMSILFSNSISIRRKFVELLSKYGGVCGIFNMEIEAKVFWWHGVEVDEDIGDAWMSPKEIEAFFTKQPSE